MASTRKSGTPMERLIRRCLNNGIKTGMQGNVNIISYDGDRDTFLALLQADASQIDHSFDQGQNSEQFSEMVAKIVAK